MLSSRRQFATTLLAGVGAAGLLPAAPAWADDDDAVALNVFISPPGKPFRAGANAPYAVADWFKEADKNGDGRIDHGEFMADSAAFFDVLDLNHENVLTPYDVAVYEHNIAPEIIANQAPLPESRLDRRLQRRPGFWLAQFGGSGGGGASPDAGMTGVLPPGADQRDPLPPHDIDESGQGASPYSFFNEPEPLTAADINSRGLIKKADFMSLADQHFTTLDRANAGFLTLAALPRTYVQQKLDRMRHRIF